MKNYPALARLLSLCLLATFSFALGLSGSAVHAATGTITGKVELDGQPAVGAKVTLYYQNSASRIATSDSYGQFKFEAVTLGKYDVGAILGNAKARVNGIEVKAGATTTADLQLAVIVAKPIVAKEENDDADDFGDSFDEGGDQSWDGGGDEFGSEDSGDDMGGGDYKLYVQPFDREGYDHMAENRFFEALKTPLSTFAIDVDAASYTNSRRFLLQQQHLPPASAVRAEEFINYFDYDYPQPTGNHPFSITTELSACPWNDQHQLVHIGLQGKSIDIAALPPANLVFLLDVSGSMDEPNKLPLVKQGLKLLVNQLRPQDRVAIVVYAGAAGLALPSTPGNQTAQIIAALDNLAAGGSTAGGEGITLAYRTARENMKPGSNNRVILCTDGDFNVGVSSDGELVKMIEKERETGVSLSVMGFGTDNYQDSKMEKLADNGNGNYNYIDQLLEAQRVLVSEVGGTLNTIAKDVKIQVEFNPAKVKSYRLIGYENRALANEDFEDDKKDAGELGAGHTVTALYEIEPVGASPTASAGTLRYQSSQLSPQASSSELLTVKFRYKAPTGTVSQLIERQCSAQPVALTASSENFRFSASVAAFAMLLTDSEHKANASYTMVKKLALGAKGKDIDGYRAEFIKMVETAALLSSQSAQR